MLREITDCGERVWWPSGTLDRPAGYNMTWTCGEVYRREMAAMDLSPEAVLAYKKALESVGGRQLRSWFYSQQGDVLAVVDEDGLMVEAIDYDL